MSRRVLAICSLVAALLLGPTLAFAGETKIGPEYLTLELVDGNNSLHFVTVYKHLPKQRQRMSLFPSGTFGSKPIEIEFLLQARDETILLDGSVHFADVDATSSSGTSGKLKKESIGEYVARPGGYTAIEGLAGHGVSSYRARVVPNVPEKWNPVQVTSEVEAVEVVRMIDQTRDLVTVKLKNGSSKRITSITFGHRTAGVGTTTRTAAEGGYVAEGNATWIYELGINRKYKETPAGFVLDTDHENVIYVMCATFEDQTIEGECPRSAPVGSAASTTR